MVFDIKIRFFMYKTYLLMVQNLYFIIFLGSGLPGPEPGPGAGARGRAPVGGVCNPGWDRVPALVQRIGHSEAYTSGIEVPRYQVESRTPYGPKGRRMTGSAVELAERSGMLYSGR